MFYEKNTKTNLPAQIELYAIPGNEYKFLYIAKVSRIQKKNFLRKREGKERRSLGEILRGSRYLSLFFFLMNTRL